MPPQNAVTKRSVADRCGEARNARTAARWFTGLPRGISRDQGIVLLATFDCELSAPADVYAFTAKYQVPDASCSTT